ncbi:WYL domain-containing protein [Vibrio anguillarum]|uniref:WYL domain-containing protein n=1 Tax=Vibrio anguillarum TaxID=55601 RepID=UPI0011DED260|nr:WYL domain-containing protein [Vibrio anguillarum]TYC93818.1 WYL domain-containing protein [Vibrio anguillarum]TYC97371.1 WYL domain-containing protein [Vibrio anguillarum]
MSKEISKRLSFGILFIPAIFAWFTLKKDYSILTRSISFGWLALTISIMATADTDSNSLGELLGFGLIFLLITFVVKAIKNTPKPPPKISFEVKTVSAADDYEEDEWKKYDSIEDWKADLTIFWAGKTDDIEFSYRKDYDSPKERKKVTPKELVFDGNKRIYIKGYCHQKQKDVHFNAEKIETKILAGSTRYDFEEWVERRLKVDIEDLSDKFGVWI